MFLKNLKKLGFIIITSAPIISFAEHGLVKCHNAKECDLTALGNTLVAIVKFLVSIGIALSAIGFAWAGFLYITAGGNSSQIAKAHQVFKKILIGFLLAIGAFLIVDLIAGTLGLNDTITKLYNKVIR